MNYFAWYQKRKKKKEKKTATLLPQRVGITTYLNAMNYFAWYEKKKKKNNHITSSTFFRMNSQLFFFYY